MVQLSKVQTCTLPIRATSAQTQAESVGAQVELGRNLARQSDCKISVTLIANLTSEGLQHMLASTVIEPRLQSPQQAGSASWSSYLKCSI